MGFNFNFVSKFRCNFQKTKTKTKSEDICRDSTNNSNHLTIKIPNRRIMSVIARSVLVFLVVASFPWIGSWVGSSSDAVGSVPPPPIDDLIFLPLFFKDLAKEGLIKPGDRAVLIGKADSQRVQMLKDTDLDLISESDIERLRSVPEKSLDFIFLSAAAYSSSAEFIDRKLKIRGIAAVRLTGDPSANFRFPLNFKIVYIRHFDATVVAMRKIRDAGGSALPYLARRRLLSLPSSKRAFLDGLEEVVLEPPAQRHRRRKGPKYLPYLMGDSLVEYPGRVFIDVGPRGIKSSGKGWLERNYPRRNQEFEIYEVEMETVEGEEGGPSAAPGMSEWLRRNVEEKEYVVMKAEAEVVERLLESRAVELVDELFMECRHDGQKWRSKRPYWECLALYGKLRDEGVAVHQW